MSSSGTEIINFREQALLALLHSYAGDAAVLIDRHPSSSELRSKFSQTPRSLAKVMSMELTTLNAAAVSVRAEVPCRSAAEYFLTRRLVAAPPLTSPQSAGPQSTPPPGTSIGAVAKPSKKGSRA